MQEFSKQSMRNSPDFVTQGVSKLLPHGYAVVYNHYSFFFFYLHIGGVTPSPLRSHCEEVEKIANSFISCKKFVDLTKIAMETPLRIFGLDFKHSQLTTSRSINPWAQRREGMCGCSTFFYAVKKI